MVRPMRIRLQLVLVLALAAAGCDRVGLNPNETRAGWRLTGQSVDAPVRDWSFTESIPKTQLETKAWWGWHSVTVWCVTVDGRLFIATDYRPRPKRWVANLDADPSPSTATSSTSRSRARTSPGSDPALWDRVTSHPNARIGLAGKLYRVRASRVSPASRAPATSSSSSPLLED